MNAQRKKSALSAWLPAVTKDTDLKDLKELILKDEKKYTDEEADEIIKAIEVALNEPAPDEKPQIPVFQEILCMVKHQKEGEPIVEKLKVIRKAVKITEEEAETLNSGMMNSSSSQVKMYFKAE